MMHPEDSWVAVLIEREPLGELIEKARSFAPSVAEVMTTLGQFADEITDDRMERFTEEALDVRRTTVAIIAAQLCDCFTQLGQILNALGLDEIVSEDGALNATGEGLTTLVNAMSWIVDDVYPKRD